MHGRRVPLLNLTSTIRNGGGADNCLVVLGYGSTCSPTMPQEFTVRTGTRAMTFAAGATAASDVWAALPPPRVLGLG
jgi:hypothetical protein